MVSLLKTNWPYKLLALAMALFFWYFVQSEEIIETSRKLTLFLDAPQDLLIRGPTVRQKEVTLAGPRSLLAYFPQENLEAHIKIPEGSLGELRYRISKEMIPHWNPRIRLIVHDTFLSVVVGHTFTRELQVHEILQGVPAAGHFVEKVLVDPPKITVTGLKAELMGLQTILTEPVMIANMEQTTEVTIPLQTQSFYAKNISHQNVRVTVKIGERKVNRRFANIPIDLVDGVRGVEPDRVSIEIQGYPRVLAKVALNDFRAFIDARDLTPGEHMRPVQVRIPADTVLIDTLPPQVKVYREPTSP